MDQFFPTLTREERDAFIPGLQAIVSQNSSDSLFEEPTTCYACEPNFFMIRADGSIGKCTVALQDERNSIGKIARDGSLEINQDKSAAWMSGWGSMDMKQLQCPYEAMIKTKTSTLEV